MTGTSPAVWSDAGGASGHSTTLTADQIAAAAAVMRVLPAAVLQPAIGLAINHLTHRHPGILEALADLGSDTVVIDPIDLPMAFLVRLENNHLSVRCLDAKWAVIKPKSRIRGRLDVLIGLVDGTLDGDALFFSRDLSVEGDTRAVVVLRNALDGAGLDMIEEVRSALGPLGNPALRLLDMAGGLLRRRGSRYAADADSLHPDSLRSPK
ncbi:ubiquinone anaerobic biosynthesis accessory factor UbiT [Rhodocista pekingensis]|uniref:SCP2 domain-containing protein n=1 Tax=Rhodocista pekingensis TaxID=201185 RepID=A0ABW2KRI0_9PROT